MIHSQCVQYAEEIYFTSKLNKLKKLNFCSFSTFILILDTFDKLNCVRLKMGNFLRRRNREEKKSDVDSKSQISKKSKKESNEAFFNKVSSLDHCYFEPFSLFFYYFFLDSSCLINKLLLFYVLVMS